MINNIAIEILGLVTAMIFTDGMLFAGTSVRIQLNLLLIMHTSLLFVEYCKTTPLFFSMVESHYGENKTAGEWGLFNHFFTLGPSQRGGYIFSGSADNLIKVTSV